MGEDLEVPEAGEQRREQRQHDEAENAQAQPRVVVVHDRQHLGVALDSTGSSPAQRPRRRRQDQRAPFTTATISPMRRQPVADHAVLSEQAPSTANSMTPAEARSRAWHPTGIHQAVRSTAAAARCRPRKRPGSTSAPTARRASGRRGRSRGRPRSRRSRPGRARRAMPAATATSRSTSAHPTTAAGERGCWTSTSRLTSATTRASDDAASASRRRATDAPRQARAPTSRPSRTRARRVGGRLE